jgi:hypothetical protein
VTCPQHVCSRPAAQTPLRDSHRTTHRRSLGTRLKRRNLAVILPLILLIPVGLVGAFPERSGPISTYPAYWTDACGLPVYGYITTTNEIPGQIASGFTPRVANFSLNQVYSKMVNSPSFRMVSVDNGWVTTYWGLQEESGPGYSYMYVVGQFVLLFADLPSGYAQVNYNLQTGEVTVDYSSGLSASCPGAR